MAAVVAPVLHRYVPPPLAVKVAKALGQIVEVAGEIAAAGSGLVLTILLAVPVHPFISATVTV